MLRKLKAARASLLAITAALWGVAGVSGAPVAAGATPLPGALAARCPKAVPETLPGDALGGAATAALEEASRIYGDLDLHGRRATQASLAAFDPDRGGFARKCGVAVYARTVVVDLEFPAVKPSSSLSQGVVLVARFDGLYRVWAVLH
jgi:hypothetical protein